jgi:exopolyphosphatase/pppGpp-phosphohydrolase
MINKLATQCVGVIEIGGRAVRLLIADVSQDSGLRIISSDWRETYLSKALLNNDDVMLRAKMEEINTIVNNFVEKCHFYKTSQIGIFGTEAVREISKRGHKFIPIISQPIIVLNKKTEAFCSLLAAVKGLPNNIAITNNVIVIDQGAGSLEIATGLVENTKTKLVGYKSYPLGSAALVRLMRENKYEFLKVKQKLRNRIDKYKLPQLNNISKIIILGSAATKYAWINARKYAGEKYNPRIVNGKSFLISEVDKFIEFANGNNPKVRQLIDPNNPASEEFEIVLSGLILIEILLRKLRKEQFVVSSSGTRYGFAWMLAQEYFKSSRLQKNGPNT